MATEPDALIAPVADHAAKLGLFERVMQHEPKSAPGKGLTAAVWVTDIRPIRSSGLAATSGRVELRVRIYTPMLQEPQDDIDPSVTRAATGLMRSLHGGFTLGGLVRCCDVLGAHGDPLRSQSGYVPQDGHLLRVMDVHVPLIINDLFEQVA